MKRCASYRTALAVQALLVVACTLVGVTGVPGCAAQSLVGHWQEVSTKLYFTAEGAQLTHGRTSEELPNSTVREDYRADHTFTETSPAAGAQAHTGTWTLSGDQLTLTPQGQKPIEATVAVTGNTLVMTIPMPRTPHRTVSKSEMTFTRVRQ